MNELIAQAEKLKAKIKVKEKQIDNPALYISTVSALDFFIENVGGSSDGGVRKSK